MTEEFTEQEIKEAFACMKYHKRQTHWYWRLCRWLADMAVCFRVAYDAALEYYRTRNE